MSAELTLSTASPSTHFLPEQTGQSASSAEQVKEYLIRWWNQIRASSQQSGMLIDLLAELEGLKEAENDDEEGYIFRAETRASEQAKDYILTAYRIMRDEFPRPKIEPDGEGGIVLDWRSGRKIIRLACRAKSHQRDYIYHQFRDRHEAEKASDSLLLNRLSWLTQDA